ncbi:hypothetical protein CEUSTIGMA_g4139.t1 [Chlamydomonas eustigma]|uniref:FAD dependent oxidoreductase domain-containing protein n=1 Tax=Chlamydomonas eustigma TaxID=1157962 RepID=A0A250X0U1_9CHLO|nr:hypothetical protein CEUSTIGMA_g4139.t1 [Chlamydomonas eustigma]|eukprot:GAX76693.1 hypothetical protein CEUSTIGMA_g4139.t1 [Chlamydomonas eustigma]
MTDRALPCCESGVTLKIIPCHDHFSLIHSPMHTSLTFLSALKVHHTYLSQKATSSVSFSTHAHLKVRTCSSRADGPQIAVVGGGVVGLVSALRILQDIPTSKVVVIAEKFGSDTTSHGAAGVWGPYKMSNTDESLTNRLATETFDYLTDLFYSEDAVLAGISLVQSNYLCKDNDPPPTWYQSVFNLHPMSAKHLSLFPAEYKHGYVFGNVTCEGRYYLPYLSDKIKGTDRGTLIQARLPSLRALCSEFMTASGIPYELKFDAVVNCCGLGAAELVEDREVYPIRGQIIRVRAPWITHHYVAGDFYIIPNRNSVVLGGTGQVGNWSKNSSIQDRKHIFEGCCRLIPSIAQAEVLEEWVGLRPGRSSLRLEVEIMDVGEGGRKPVVHCYGHGGSGLTLAWGCGGDVVTMLKQSLQLL